MRTSTEKALDVTHDLLDATRSRASELASAGAQQLSTSIEKGATTLESAVDRLPTIELFVAPPPRTHKLRNALLVVAAVVIAVAAVSRLRQRAAADRTSPSPGDDAAPSSPARLHVVPAEGGGWDVTEDDGGEPASHHGTQAEGVEEASRVLAQADGGEVVVHALDGRPRDTRRVAPADPS
jgi:hypothetical protein